MRFHRLPFLLTIATIIFVMMTLLTGPLFTGPLFIVTSKQPLFSSVFCRGECCAEPLSRNRSCFYKNLYYRNGAFHFIAPTHPPPETLFVKTWSRPWTGKGEFYHWIPTLVPSSTLPEAKVMRGLSVFASHVDANPGHSLLDMLLPSYMSAVRFGFDQRTYRTVLGSDYLFSEQTSMVNIFQTFGGAGLVALHKLRRERWYMFEELTIGGGHMGLMTFDSNYSSCCREHGAIWKFSRRMLERFNLTGSEGRSLRQVPNVGLVQTKRRILNQPDELIATLEKMLPVKVRWIQWESMPSFRDQLNLAQELDIHISGVGTGQMNQIFLRPGSVHISLGQAFEGYTTFYDEYVTGATDYIEALFYPGYKRSELRPSGYMLDVNTLGTLIEKALAIRQRGVPFPSSLSSRQSVWAKVCSEIFHRDPETLLILRREIDAPMECAFCKCEEVAFQVEPFGVSQRCRHNSSTILLARKMYSSEIEQQRIVS